MVSWVPILATHLQGLVLHSSWPELATLTRPFLSLMTLSEGNSMGLWLVGFYVSPSPRHGTCVSTASFPTSAMDDMKKIGFSTAKVDSRGFGLKVGFRDPPVLREGALPAASSVDAPAWLASRPRQPPAGRLQRSRWPPRPPWQCPSGAH